MAWTSLGYDGTVNETGDAIRSPHIGAGTPVVVDAADFLVTINPAADRTLRIAPGTAWGFGVLATSDSQLSVQLPTITTGNRWDAIVLRRDWPSNTNTVTYVANTLLNTKALPTGLANSPGVQHDQVLALVQVTAGQTVPTSVLDLRAWAAKTISAGDLMAIPFPYVGMEAVITPTPGGVATRYRRALDANSNPVWLRESGDLTTLTGSSLITPVTNWALSSTTTNNYMIRSGKNIDLYIEMRRGGTRILPDAYGSVTDQQFASLVTAAPRPDRNTPFTFQYFGGNVSTDNGSYGGFGMLRTDGGLYLNSLAPSQAINSISSGVSLRAHISYMKVN